jgi:hypothetical protein
MIVGWIGTGSVSMSNSLAATCALTMLLGAAAAASQAPAPDAKKASAPMTATGCVSSKPDSTGRYTFTDSNGVSQYQLNGKKLSQFAGKRVELVGGTSGSGLSVRPGLVGPMGGARGVALDPAQDSIKRQPGGGGAGIGPAFPEFKVTRIKAVEGACEEAGPR